MIMTDVGTEFRATPVEKRTDDDKQDAHAQPTDKGVQSYGNETKAPPALIDEKK